MANFAHCAAPLVIFENSHSAIESHMQHCWKMRFLPPMQFFLVISPGKEEDGRRTHWPNSNAAKFAVTMYTHSLIISFVSGVELFCGHCHIDVKECA